MQSSRITKPKAKEFWNQFLLDREINTEFYRRIPNDKLDFRMVDRPDRRSDSPRESLVHQIAVSRGYIQAVQTGTLRFGNEYEDIAQSKNLSKEVLLKKLAETSDALLKALYGPAIGDKKVKVPWSHNPIPAITCLWALDSHEILHTGWNLALMDHLGIDRFPALKAMWG